jgi:hypothetical protein
LLPPRSEFMRERGVASSSAGGTEKGWLEERRSPMESSHYLLWFAEVVYIAAGNGRI